MSAKQYAKAGVDIDAGDAASSLAGQYAKTTFAGRKGRIGMPAKLPGGYAGALDFGDHYVVTCDDGTGTKMAVAEALGRYDTLGYDLAAMVADDAVCLGAEVISISNTLDCPHVDKKVIGDLLKGLAQACREQKIVIPGGEIAEVGKTVNGLVWNATAIGVVAKKRLLDGSKIRVGDAVIALQERGLRSNGFSLARYILTNTFGANWHTKKFQGKAWGEWLLTPSTIYHAAILRLIGRYSEKAVIDVHGVSHITGGGIIGNLPRILKSPKLGAKLDRLWEPPAWVTELIRLGKVDLEEAREVWNMGNGMLVIVAQKDVTKTLTLLKKSHISAKVAGEITGDGQIVFQ